MPCCRALSAAARVNTILTTSATNGLAAAVAALASSARSAPRSVPRSAGTGARTTRQMRVAPADAPGAPSTSGKCPRRRPSSGVVDERLLDLSDGGCARDRHRPDELRADPVVHAPHALGPP